MVLPASSIRFEATSELQNPLETSHFGKHTDSCTPSKQPLASVELNSEPKQRVAKSASPGKRVKSRA